METEAGSAIRTDRSVSEKTAAERSFQIVLYGGLALFALLCVIPLILVISSSLTEEKNLAQYGYRLWPKEFSLSAYAYVFKNGEQLLTSYGVTALVTAVGTLLGLLVCSLLAYPMSRKDFRFRNGLSFYVFFTMLFNGGLVPTYIVVTQFLHLKDTIWALILAHTVSAFYVLLLKTFFATIPDSLVESAKLEGAGEFRIFFGIAAPLAKPALATVGLFFTLIYWNDWFQALLYIDDRDLLPLQYLLVMLMTSIEFMDLNPNATSGMEMVPTETVRMAMAVLAVGPMSLVYLYFQKFFVRGLTVGAVKS
ncbi:carbohydrate ABC transporter permease [Paenibacillus sp. 32352]|uniref:carbohydrate ABC transporter permease n=1 Tax=Paenibacillus sp. 32352 TaxID=1969111 RepID=UPI0009AC1889|nr:carbohydrate ABC transporter permease [Paenibacillus sp. 32352]